MYDSLHNLNFALPPENFLGEKCRFKGYYINFAFIKGKNGHREHERI